MLMKTLPSASLVFCFLSLQTCYRPFPGLPLLERIRKVLAAMTYHPQAQGWLCSCHHIRVSQQGDASIPLRIE